MPAFSETKPLRMRSTSVDPTTFYGFLDTVEDALLVVAAATSGSLPRVTQRLEARQQQQHVRSGAVFVYDEQESGVRSCSGLTSGSTAAGTDYILILPDSTMDGQATLVSIAAD